MSLIDAFTRPRKDTEIRPGDRFRRNHGKGLTETAEVVSLRTDLQGIPHVRFKVRFERIAAEPLDTALRILAVPEFRNTYGSSPV